jgi:hypothetical protein
MLQFQKLMNYTDYILHQCENLGSHGCEHDNSNLIGFCAVLPRKKLPMFHYRDEAVSMSETSANFYEI